MDKEEAAPAAFISGKRDKLWMPRPINKKTPDFTACSVIFFAYKFTMHRKKMTEI